MKKRKNEIPSKVLKLIKSSIQDNDICTYDKTGQLHSINNLPALTRKNLEIWYDHGKISRKPNDSGEQLPAIIKYNKNNDYSTDDENATFSKIKFKIWLIDGIMSRQNGLHHAEYLDNKALLWFIDEKVSRIDKDHNGYTLPAIIHNRTSGIVKVYYKNGVIHNEDIDIHTGETRPAVEDYSKNYFEWKINGEYCRRDKDKNGNSLHTSYDKNFDEKIWYNIDGKISRIDVDENGMQLPAIESSTKNEYVIDGKLHRNGTDSNGYSLPSIIEYEKDPHALFPHKHVEWWTDSNRMIGRNEKDKLTGLLLPACIDYLNNTKTWYENDKISRTEKDHETGYTLPAIIQENVYYAWFFNGKIHRSDKDDQGYTLPAIRLSRTIQTTSNTLIMRKIRTIKFPDHRNFEYDVYPSSKVLCFDDQDYVYYCPLFSEEFYPCYEAWYTYGKLDRTDRDKFSGLTLPAVKQIPVEYHWDIDAWKKLSPNQQMYTEKYYIKNTLDRRDRDSNGYLLPAYIKRSGASWKKVWTKGGLEHRTEKDEKTGYTLPAVEYSNGTMMWYTRGMLNNTSIDRYTGHRLPTIIAYPDPKIALKYQLRSSHHVDELNKLFKIGGRMWHINDSRSRNENDADNNPLPAILYADGSKKYYIDNCECEIKEPDWMDVELLDARLIDTDETHSMITYEEFDQIVSMKDIFVWPFANDPTKGWWFTRREIKMHWQKNNYSSPHPLTNEPCPDHVVKMMKKFMNDQTKLVRIDELSDDPELSNDDDDAFPIDDIHQNP